MNQMKTMGTGTAVAVFEGYVDGQPLVKWLDRRNMPQPGARLYVGAAPMCERKTAKLEEEGYGRTGYVLRQPGKEREVAVSEGGAVSWFTLDQWNWLMFNRDHVAFKWPAPLADRLAESVKPPPASEAQQNGVDGDAVAPEADRRYCEPTHFEGIEDERAKFEAWATGADGPWLQGALARDEHGYISTEVREHWSMWANFAVRRVTEGSGAAAARTSAIHDAEVSVLLTELERVGARGAGEIPGLCTWAGTMIRGLRAEQDAEQLP